MNHATFFTPSYTGDLARAIWLRRSVETFFDGQAPHIISVPNRDMPAFRRSLGQQENVQLIPQEEFVDAYFFPNTLYRIVSRLAPSQLWRFEKHAGKRGWIIQQIVKLNCSRLIKDGAVVFLDSDLFFIRHFSLRDLGLDKSQRILVRNLPSTESARHRQHITNSRLILGIPPGSTDHTYMGSPAIWYVDWLNQLHNYLEIISGKPWQQVLFDVQFNISEYTIYGVFIDEVVKARGLRIRDDPYNLIAWDHASFKDLKTTMLHDKEVPKNKISLVIQSNIGIPTAEYEDMLRHILSHCQER
jgi:hypothetical protein